MSGVSCIHRERGGQETKEKITVEDVDRSTVRLPRGYDPQQHYPVVILLHGMNQDPDDMERLTRFDELADKDSIIAVYPVALHGRWNVGVRPTRSVTTDVGLTGVRAGVAIPAEAIREVAAQREPGQQSRPVHADDVEFFNQMLDQIAIKFSVDSSRVYFAGLSDGGFMTTRVGCALRDRVAAVATVGAAMPKTMICLPLASSARCHDQRYVGSGRSL